VFNGIKIITIIILKNNKKIAFLLGIGDWGLGIGGLGFGGKTPNPQNQTTNPTTTIF